MMYPTVSLRDYIGKSLNTLYNPRLFVLDGDLAGATRTEHFQKEHPDHFIECGISETSAVSIATGLAMEGMIPFYVNFAVFCTGSAWTQVRMACYAKADLKLLSTHPGMDNGPDGATHHGLEDMALMRVLPGMHIFIPQSPDEVHDAIKTAMDTTGPCYVRVSRDVVPVLTDQLSDDRPFGGVRLRYDDGDDFAILYEGSALMAAKEGFDLLRASGKKGKMIQIQTLKPFPAQELLQLTKKIGILATVENHTVIGGLGGAVAEMLSEHPRHTLLLRIGVRDEFTQSGPTALVKARYGLSGQHVAKAIAEHL